MKKINLLTASKKDLQKLGKIANLHSRILENSGSMYLADKKAKELGNNLFT